jgi:hypothetical protein
MSRILLAVLLVASLWPAWAAAPRDAAHMPEWESAVERLEPGGPLGARLVMGGWDLLARPVPDTRDRDGRRLLAGLDTLLGADAATAFSAPTVVAVDDALRDAGVLRARFEHLPYFATAPPSLQ